METKLERISQLSKENPNMVFTSIAHLINKELLKSCYESMDKGKKKFSHKCKEVHKLIGEMRTLPVKEIVKKLNQILVGYYHYYGIMENIQRRKKIMLTLEGLIGVISLCGTMFAIGYAIGQKK